jgi:hypothetical protein
MKKGGCTMKRLIGVVILVLFLAGCGATVRESGFYDHDSHYKTLDHVAFSWWGYKHPTAETMKESTEQGWWGLEIPYIPAQ